MPYDALCVVRARLHARVQSADYGLQTTENNYRENSTEKKALKNGGYIVYYNFSLCVETKRESSIE